MCQSEQQSIEQNICELLEKVKQCCLTKEEVSNLRQQIDSVQLWINGFDNLTSNDIVINESIGDFPENTPIQTILEYLYTNINNSVEGDYQDSIQFKKTGVNLGSNGTVKEINFIGGGVDVNRTANVLTVNVPSSNTNLSIGNRNSTNLDVISSTGVNATLPPATTSLAGLFTSTDKLKLDGIQLGAEQNVNADWNSTSGDSLILNKPIIPSIVGLATISYVDTQDGLKQNKIQFKNQGVNLGVSGIVETINFTGSVVTASLVGNVLTVDITGGSGSGVTNLDFSPSPSQGTVTSDTGTDAVIPLANSTNAGLLSPSNSNKLNFITVTQGINLDNVENKITNLVTLSGVAVNSINLGIFSGNIIPDNQTIKAAIQSLETSIETNYTTFNRQNKIRVVSVNTTLSTSTDGIVVMDTVGTTATLPPSVNEIILTVKNSSNGSVSVSGNIDGIVSNYTLSSKESMRFHGNGVTWYYIG